MPRTKHLILEAEEGRTVKSIALKEMRLSRGFFSSLKFQGGILLDGKQGTVLDELRVSGSVAMSPAVYRDMLVIASTGEDGAHIYGIGLETNSEENDQ